MFRIKNESLENQFNYPIPKGSKLIFFAPHGVGVNEENQWAHMQDSQNSIFYFTKVKYPSNKYEPLKMSYSHWHAI
jgi:hypothetical protein